MILHSVLAAVGRMLRYAHSMLHDGGFLFLAVRRILPLFSRSASGTSAYMYGCADDAKPWTNQLSPSFIFLFYISRPACSIYRDIAIGAGAYRLFPSSYDRLVACSFVYFVGLARGYVFCVSSSLTNFIIAKIAPASLRSQLALPHI